MNVKCERCLGPMVPGDDHSTSEGCIKGLQRDIEALYGVVEHLTATTGSVVARVELCHTKGQPNFVFYITTGSKTKDDVLAKLIAAQLKSAYIFGSLLRQPKPQRESKTP